MILDKSDRTLFGFFSYFLAVSDVYDLFLCDQLFVESRWNSSIRADFCVCVLDAKFFRKVKNLAAYKKQKNKREKHKTDIHPTNTKYTIILGTTVYTWNKLVGIDGTNYRRWKRVDNVVYTIHLLKF